MNESVKKNSESQMQFALGMLLRTASDKHPVVVEAVHTSLRKIADNNTNDVLLACCTFEENISQANPSHLAIVLSIMEKICQDHAEKVDGDTIITVINLGVQVMCQNNGCEQLQQPASGVLVAIGRLHYVLVMEALLKELRIGIVPHSMIPYTLGTLATSSPFGIVPYLKNVLSIILPLLGAIKVDSLKQAFSYALGSFADAILEFTSSEQSAEPNIRANEFDIEFGMAYDVLFCSWLNSKEEKVTESVIKAIGSMFPLLNSEKVSQQTAKMVSAILLMLKKQTATHSATQCLGSVISVASRTNGTLLEPLLGAILQSICDYVCIAPDYAQPESLRSHSEVLRCYECLANHFTDHTVDYLMGQLKLHNEKDRIRSLLIVTHLTNSAESAVRSRSKDLLKCLNDLVNDPYMRVKAVLLKAIVAFAYRGLLTDDNIAEASKFMDFILKLSCKQVVPKGLEVNSQNMWDLQKSADTTLLMLSTSVSTLETVLWDILLKCFITHRYEEAVVTVLKCLTHLASKRAVIDNDEAIVIRCFALLSNPLADFRGTLVLNFLKNLKLSKTAILENKIMQLTNYLEQNYDNFNQNEWQDFLLGFLGRILENQDAPNYCQLLIEKTKEQLQLYNTNLRDSFEGAIDKRAEKHFLLKCLATMASHLEDKDKVLSTLEIILESVKLNDLVELQTCAQAIGSCARKHLLIILDKLSVIRKDLLLKKPSKLFKFNFMKEHKTDHEIENIRYVVICSYADICNEASAEQIVPIVEKEILAFVIEQLAKCKDNTIRKVCLRTIGCVAEVMQPSKNIHHIRMQNRDEVLKIVMSQMHLHSGPEYIELFPVILSVLTSLVRLPVPLESSQRLELLKLVFDNIYNSAAIYCRINPENDSLYYSDSKHIPYIITSFPKLNSLVVQLLLQNLCPSTLDEVLTLLELWLNKKRMEQRLPAMETLRVLLQAYLDNVRFAYETPTSFGQSGTLLSKVVPRCMDPNKNIRKVALDCLSLVLCIVARYEGHMKDHDKALKSSLEQIKEQIETDEPKQLYNLTADLAHVISINLPQSQLPHFVFGLVDALLDCEEASSIASSVVLNSILKSKGSELLTHVNDVFEKLIAQLDNIKCNRTRSSALRGVLSLATHHPKIAVSRLLAQPLPFSTSVCDCWSAMSTDHTLVVDILDQLKKIIKLTPAYEEETSSARCTPIQALQAVSALHELFKNTQLYELCNQQFSELFSLLLVTLASYIGTSCKSSSKDSDISLLNRKIYKLNPAKVVLDTFKLFLLCCESSRSAASLLLCTHLEEDQNLASFQQMVSSLAESVSLERVHSLSWLVACLGPYIRSEIEPQRIAATCFFANLLKFKVNDQVMLAENLLEMLLDVQSDRSCQVRKLAIEGLGHGTDSLSTDLITRHCNPILSALMQGLDYNNVSAETPVILHSLLSFSKLLQKMEGYKLSSFQITAVVRIKPLLSQENTDLRRAAFHLFGDLTLSLNIDNKSEAFKEQLEGNLITFILHLSDPDVEVVKACKYTLRKIGGFLEAPKSNMMIQEHLVEEGNLICTDFIIDFVKVMADELQDLFPLFVMTAASYLKSQWIGVRGYAALLTGLLYSHMSESNKSRLSFDTVCDRLLKLLNDEQAEIRMRAVQGVSYLLMK